MKTILNVNMNSSKKINVNYSSLVGLKAELLRKQTEVKDAKVNSDTVLTQPKQKVRNKKPKTNKLKIEKELIDVDDIKAHKKSKLMLEAKARLYENLKKSHSNKNEHFLVDFQNKSDSEDDRICSDDYEDANSDPEEDWVEYEDCFGRTRKCLRRDLPSMQEKDDFVKDEVMKRSQPDEEREEEIRHPSAKIIPKEPEIEIMRRKWEEQTEKLTEKMDIHYQDILFDEARAHGVGYYEFSHDEEERAKQQQNLNILRKETLQKQKEMQSLKELKDKMEHNRLKAARIRQRIRAGLPPEPEEEENDKEEKDDKESKQEIDEEDESGKEEVAENKEQNSLVEIENKIKAFGELLGKRTHWHEMSQEEWVHKRRKDRNDEFAPLYSEFKSAGYLEDRANNSSANASDPKIIRREKEFITNKQISQKIDSNNTVNSETQANAKETVYNVDTESSDSNDSDVIGPMPLPTEPHGQQANVEEAFSELPESVRTELSHIDFSKPPPNMRIETSSETLPFGSERALPAPVPPPNPAYSPMGYDLPVSALSSSEIDSKLLDTSNGQSSQPSLDENKITAGLKYLRANFEQQKFC